MAICAAAYCRADVRFGPLRPSTGRLLAATDKCLARRNKTRMASSLTCLQALLRLFRDPHARLANNVCGVIIAAAAFLAGLCGERLRAKLARQAWQKRRWRRGEGGVPKTGAAPDPAEQLRLVMGARFEKRRLLSRSEAQVCTPPKGQSTLRLRTSSGV